MKIDLNEVAVFNAIITAGSFTQAAFLLDTPKSTVSRKFAQLEKRLGIPLLTRSSRGITLTTVGKHYHQHYAQALIHIENAELSIQNIQGEPTGKLRIAMPLAFDTPFIINTIGQFCERYPKINIDIKLDDRNLDLIKEGIDITFRAGPLKDSSLVATLIAKTPFILCASISYLKGRSIPTNLHDLKSHTLICHNQFLPWKAQYQDENIEYSPEARYSSNDIGNVHKLISNHLGIGPIPTMICAQELKQGNLKKLLPQYAFEDCDIHLVYPSRKGLSSKVSLFKSFFIEQSNLHSPWSG